MEEFIKPQKVVCPVCKKVLELYAINPINQNAPCLECLLKQLNCELPKE